MGTSTEHFFPNIWNIVLIENNFIQKYLTLKYEYVVLQIKHFLIIIWNLVAWAPFGRVKNSGGLKFQKSLQSWKMFALFHFCSCLINYVLSTLWKKLWLQKLKTIKFSWNDNISSGNVVEVIEKGIGTYFNKTICC
jgi:hypothetical protein